MFLALSIITFIGLIIGELTERIITRFILSIIFHLKKSTTKFKNCNHQWSTISDYALAYTHGRAVIYCPCCDSTLDGDYKSITSMREKSKIKKQYTDNIMKNIEKELLKAKTDLENFKEYNELIIENSYNSELEKSLKGYDK